MQCVLFHQNVVYYDMPIIKYLTILVWAFGFVQFTTTSALDIMAYKI